MTQYAMRAGQKLRSHQLVAGQPTVFFHTNRFRKGASQYQGMRRIALHPMTADSLEPLAAARRGVETAWRDGYSYTKPASCSTTSSITKCGRTLFEGGRRKRDQLMTALDEVNSKFGRFTVVPAAQGFRQEWKMRSEGRSPAWTTRIDDAPVVRARSPVYPAQAPQWAAHAIPPMSE